MPWGLSSYTVLCRGVGQARNKLGLVPSAITSLHKPLEVQKPPGERYAERKSDPSLERVQALLGSEAHKE